MDIYRAAKRRGKYQLLATDTEVNSCLRACSHGGGGPQVGEVPYLPVVKESYSFHMQDLPPRGAGVRFPNAFTR